MESYFTVMFAFFFLPITLFLYQVFPAGKRWIVLLAASLLFFWSISQELILFVILSGFLIYFFGLWMEKIDGKEESHKLAQKKKKKVLIFAIFINIGILVLCKYAGFLLGNINTLFSWFNISVCIKAPKIGLPIGISFYSLQAVSYCVDVYRKRVQADHNPLRLLLFLSFFPTIMEGPICRYEQTAYALWEGKPISYHSLTFGAQRILWGVFKKLVIADRLNPMVNELFTNYQNYSGGMVLVAMVTYTIQLYMDFSGTMDVVIGIAQIFGITLPENFRQPFFSKSIAEFWQRWHITLGTWFKDYIFYPISMSKMAKKITKKTKKKLGYYYAPLVAGSIALLAVWIGNGLWHGAGWHFIFFGLYHFFFILMGNLMLPLLRKYHLQFNHGILRYIAMFRTTVLVCIGELIFRADGLRIALSMIQKMFVDFSFRSLSEIPLSQLHIDIQDILLIIVSLIVVFIISICKEKNVQIRYSVAALPTVFRWTLYYTLIFSIILFGAYGAGYVPVDPMYASY